jgi:hypothetical protein
MPTRYTWKVPPVSDAVTEFHLEKSTDNGITWDSVADIDNDTTDPLLYDADEDRFFWVDPTPEAAEIVRIAAENAVGTGPYQYLYSPPALPTSVNVYGVVLDPVRNAPYPGAEVVLTIGQGRNAAQQANTGVASFNSEGALVATRTYRTFTDDQGRWSLNVMRDVPAQISIPDVGHTRSFILPTDPEVVVVNFRDLVKYRTQGPLLTRGPAGTTSGVGEGQSGLF